jgi:hypothetical protein
MSGAAIKQIQAYADDFTAVRDKCRSLGIIFQNFAKGIAARSISAFVGSALARLVSSG